MKNYNKNHNSNYSHNNNYSHSQPHYYRNKHSQNFNHHHNAHPDYPQNLHYAQFGGIQRDQYQPPNFGDRPRDRFPADYAYPTHPPNLHNHYLQPPLDYYPPNHPKYAQGAYYHQPLYENRLLQPPREGTKEDRKQPKEQKDNNKNNYEYICLNVRHHSDLINYIKERKWEYRVISDIKKEIKSNNSIEHEHKNFYISVPKDDILKMKDGPEDEAQSSIKRKRKDMEDSPEADQPDSQPNAQLPIKEEETERELGESSEPTKTPKQEADPNAIKEEEGVEGEKRPKMVSMNEARKKAVGYERKFCFIIGFPIDLDTEELVTEMVNLGCRNPAEIKWYYDENYKDKLKDIIECEFADDKDVDILLKADLMVRRRNIMVLPKIKDKSVYEMIAFHQVHITYKYPDDYIVSNVRPLHLFNCFLTFGHIVSLNIGFHPDPTIITFVKKGAAEQACQVREFKGEPGTMKLQVNNGYTYLKIDYVKHIRKNGFPLPYKKFYKEDDGTSITCDDKYLMETIVKKSIETKFEGVKVTQTDEKNMWTINSTLKGLSKDVIKFIKNQDWYPKLKINNKPNEDY